MATNNKMMELAETVANACVVVRDHDMVDAVEATADSLYSWLSTQKQPRAVLVAALGAAISLLAKEVQELAGAEKAATIQ